MFRGLKWRFIIYAAVTVFAILLLLPTLTPDLPPWFTKVIPTEKIHLGLDLQGGMHLILEVEAEKAVESYVERIKNNLKDDFKEKGIPVGKMEREGTDQIVFEVSGEKEKWEKLLSDRYSMMQEKSATALEKGIWKVALVLDSRQADQIKKSAIDQALGDDPEPDRSVRRFRARDYPPGNRSHPDPTPGHERPSKGNQSDRPDSPVGI